MWFAVAQVFKISLFRRWISLAETTFTDMFPRDAGFFWGAVVGAICGGIVTVLCIKIREEKDADERQRRAREVERARVGRIPEEHDER